MRKRTFSSISQIEINEVVYDVIETFKAHSDKALSIVFNNTSDLKYISADPVHFRNILSNLVDNAIKYARPDVSITIECSSDEDYVQFSVTDNGIGIPSAELDLIFEKFHRVQTGTYIM